MQTSNLFSFSSLNYFPLLLNELLVARLSQSRLSGCFCILPQNFGKVVGTYE